jgi:signal transduction histidine kinase
MLSRKFREMPAEKLEKSLSALDESARNAFHLMDNLLQWSRSKLKRIHPRKGDHVLQVLVADTAEMFQPIIRYKEICFSNAILAECRVHADADILGCVIRNLLSNAIKYTPVGGSIDISCELHGDEVCVGVRDSGTGIAASLDAIFSDTVVSAAGLMQEKGSGIGLKLCKDFVELNGGRIWADSNYGGGTSFFFTVPAAQVVSASGGVLAAEVVPAAGAATAVAALAHQ